MPGTVLDLYQRVSKDWLEFCACEQEHKESFSSPVYGECGYNKVGKEAVALSEAGKEVEKEEGGYPDPVESLENGYSDSLTGKFPRSENGYRHGDKLRDSYRDLYTQLGKASSYFPRQKSRKSCQKSCPL